MAYNTGIWRHLYWDPDIDVIQGTTNALHTAALTDALIATQLLASGKPFADRTHYVADVTLMPDFGAPPSTTDVPVFGRTVAPTTPVQATGQQADITLALNEGASNTNIHRMLQKLATNEQIVVVIFTFRTPYPTGKIPETIAPGDTGAKLTTRIIQGTKAGRGLVPGGGVQDVESYNLSIAVNEQVGPFYTD